MYKSFRTALAAVALLAGFASATQAATHEIEPGVFSFVSDSGYYSMFVVTEDGVAVFETVNSAHSSAMLEEIREITDQPIKYALQSHNHWDHAGGGSVMQEAGAKTVMHAFAADWLAQNPGRDTSTPDIVWSGARRDIPLGDVTIQLHYLGLSHGVGMTVFVIPEHRVAYIADLVTPNRVMFSIVPDFNFAEWERTLGEILALDFDNAVCSHNDLPAEDALKGCTKVHVEEERAYLQDLRDAIFAEFAKGTDPGTIPSTIELPQYAHWNHYEEWLGLNAQRMILDIFMGPFSWLPTGTALTCVDTDPVGDGWGWDGSDSCRIEKADTTSCIDTDPVGDGWGWDGSSSCRVEQAATTCVDTDPVGDGWGWDGTTSCRIGE